jgi:hypothetical protein
LKRKEYSTGYLWFFAALVSCSTVPALSGPVSVDPNSFHASFFVDSNAMSLSSAVATIEPRLGVPGYSWLRITFYTFLVTADDIAGVMKGDTGSMDKKWN